MNGLKQAKTSFFLISCLLLFNLGHSQMCNFHEKNVLLIVKHQCGNPPSLSSWNSSTNCCTDWSNKVTQVDCDGEGHVVGVTIVGANDINSEIPRALGDLPLLEILTLQHIPHLYGEIPGSTLCKITNLLSLAISFNNLTGTIPDCLGQLEKLSHFEITDTGVSGRIPPSITQIPNLGTLFMTNNKLCGPIPDFPAELKYLNFINLSNNSLSGPLPTSLARLSRLGVLSLSDNMLNGSILPSLAQLSRLYWLDLANNQFKGSIPASFGSLPEAVHVELQGNQMTGLVPTSLGRHNATWLDLSNNRFIGDASFLFARNKSWTDRIILSNNRFKFNFSNVELPKNLIVLNISDNKIYGSLPKAVDSLSIVDVSYNQLCGQIPSGYEQFEVGAFAHNKCLCGSPLAACE